MTVGAGGPGISCAHKWGPLSPRECTKSRVQVPTTSSLSIIYIEKCTYVYMRACACERRVEPDELVFVFVSSSVNNAPVYASLFCRWYTAVSEHLTAEL